MEELETYRKRIDEIDNQLIALFAERFGIVRAVGQLKAENNIAIVQSTRAQQVVNRVTDMARESGIPPEFIKALYEDMIDHAHVIEHAIEKDHNERS